MSADRRTLLQRGALGTVCRVEDGGPGISGPCLERDTRAARCGLRLVARWIVAREARALKALRGVSGVPPLLDWNGRVLRRGWIDAQPLHAVEAGDPRYYREALRLVRRLHAAGVVHNHLHHEPHWLVAADGSPALVGFGGVSQPRYRGWRFKALARDDLRQWLQLKQRHCRQPLTARQRKLAAQRSVVSALCVRLARLR